MKQCHRTLRPPHPPSTPQICSSASFPLVHANSCRLVAFLPNEMQMNVIISRKSSHWGDVTHGRLMSSDGVTSRTGLKSCVFTSRQTQTLGRWRRPLRKCTATLMMEACDFAQHPLQYNHWHYRSLTLSTPRYHRPVQLSKFQFEYVGIKIWLFKTVAPEFFAHVKEWISRIFWHY